MAQPYVGEIRMFGGSFAPAGWMFCAGQLLPISENETLFQLIGTTYGGDGESTFALPDLQGRVPIHQGGGPGLSNWTLAEAGGSESVTLTSNQMPVHNHTVSASTSIATESSPAANVVAQSSAADLYVEDILSPTDPALALAPATVTGTGGSQPHDNMQPYLCVTFIISLFGIFPSPT
jgi:microcystin-dependent protein